MHNQMNKSGIANSNVVFPEYFRIKRNDGITNGGKCHEKNIEKNKLILWKNNFIHVEKNISRSAPTLPLSLLIYEA